MANIKAVKQNTPFDGSITLYKWSGLTENDVGLPVIIPARADRSAQFIGNFGGGQIDLEGSNVPESVLDAEHATLSDPFGSPIEALAAGMFGITENTYQVRPKPVSGSSMSVDVYLLAIRTAE